MVVGDCIKEWCTTRRMLRTRAVQRVEILSVAYARVLVVAAILESLRYHCMGLKYDNY